MPVCLNAIPAPCQAALFRSLPERERSLQNRIPSSPSFSSNRRLGNKKSWYTNTYRPEKRIDLSLVCFGIKLSVTFICLLTVQSNLGAAMFLLSTLQHCPTLSRPLKKCD